MKRHGQQHGRFPYSGIVEGFNGADCVCDLVTHFTEAAAQYREGIIQFACTMHPGRQRLGPNGAISPNSRSVMSNSIHLFNSAEQLVYLYE